MIVEHEVIEQIEEDESGRPLTWICDLIRSLGRDDSLRLLLGMWRAGHLVLTDRSGSELPRWRCDEVFREPGEVPQDVFVAATDAGSRWVHKR